MTPQLRRLIVAVLIAVLGAVGITVAITRGDNGKTITVTVPAKVAHAPPGDLNLAVPLDNGGQPSPSTVERNQPNELGLLPSLPPAGAQIIHCSPLFGGHLYSSRGGIHPTIYVVHYTAGNGTAESIDSYFRRTRAGSATDILEPNGHCRQEVPVSEKPWTQLAANPYSISVEIVTTGWNVSRAGWLAMPIFSKGYLAALMRDRMRPAGIPFRRVDPVGCNFTPGYTDHNALECGNDHTDVLPNFPWDVLARQLNGPVYVVTKPARRQCRIFNTYTRRLKANGHLGSFGTRRRRRAQRYFVKNHDRGHTNYDCYSDNHVRVRIVKR